MNISIRPATVADAPLIGWGICTAIGDELVAQLGVNTSPQTVCDVFTSLAASTDTQYSWQNSIVAEADGQCAGVIVAYDGADLIRLREAFIAMAAERLNIDFSDVPPECEPGEVYIDTLAVKPQFRGVGIAKSLIQAAVAKANTIGKPAGLLVADDNPNARRLYEKCGFRPVGRCPFAGEMMSHMQKIS